MTAEPLCCGEPMVHNSFTGEYECSSAYFALVDELGESRLAWSPLENWSASDVGPDLAEALEHWRSSRTPDGADL